MGQPNENNGLDKVAVKTMASFTKGVAGIVVKPTSLLFMHQPKEPKDLEKRLQEMKK